MGSTVSTAVGFQKDVCYLIDSINKLKLSTSYIENNIFITQFDYTIYFYHKNKICYRIELINKILTISKNPPNDDLINTNLDFVYNNPNINTHHYDFMRNPENILFNYEFSKHINCLLVFNYSQISEANYDITPNATIALGNMDSLIIALRSLLKIHCL